MPAISRVDGDSTVRITNERTNDVIEITFMNNPSKKIRYALTAPDHYRFERVTSNGVEQTEEDRE